MAIFAFLFNLWASTVAVAAVAVSIPIIIHLLNRRRFKIVDWAAMRFLMQAQKQTTRKLRLEQILLLALRCLLLLLLVLAMASVMPWAEDLWAWVNPEGATTLSRPEGKVHHILVIDGSLSMNQTVDRGKSGEIPAFQRALEQAVRTVRRGRAGDGFSVLLLKDNPTWIIGNGTDMGFRVEEEVRKLIPSHGNASLASALNLIRSKVLESNNRFQTQVVYFYTDMQRATWQGALDIDKEEKKDREEKKEDVFKEIQKDAQFALIDVGPEKADTPSNLAVVDLYLPEPLVTTGQKLEVRARIKNFGPDSRTLTVKLQVSPAHDFKGAQELSAKAKEVGPMSEETFSFSYLFAKAGSYVLKVLVESEGTDSLVLDDARYLVVPVKDAIPILVVGGAPEGLATRAEKEAHLVKIAGALQGMLNPDPGRENGEWTRLMPEARTQEEFAGMGPAELEKFDCLFLVDIAPPRKEEVDNLKWFLRRGRGVVMSVGDRSAAHMEKINAALYEGEKGLLPGRLDKEIALEAPHFYVLDAQEEEFRRPPLRAFSDEKDKISIASRPFQKYLQVTTASKRVRGVLYFHRELDPKVPVDPKLDIPTGDAALLEWNPLIPSSKKDRSVGRPYPGRFILFTSTFHRQGFEEGLAHDGWNFWAGSANFGAMMQELVRLAVPARLMGQAALVSEPLEGSFTRPREKVYTALTFPNVPGLKEQPEPRHQIFPTAEETLEYQFLDTDFVGVYRLDLTNGAGKELSPPILFAVNPPSITGDRRASESDLTRWKEDDLKNHYKEFKFQLVRDGSKVNVEAGHGKIVEERVEQGPTIARYILLVFLGLLFLEIILAWMFGHYTKVEGATAPAPMGLSWPLGIAITGLVLFLVGAYVAFDAKKQGEFLGFLPDRFRTWTETKVWGMEAPQAVENSHWSYVEQPWLPEFLDQGRGWFLLFASVAALVMVLFIYMMEGPTVSGWFKCLLAGLRFFLIMLTIHWLLPQPENNFNRSDKPVLLVLIDDSLSMGVGDELEDEEAQKKAKELSERIRNRLEKHLPGRIKDLETRLLEVEKRGKTDGDPETDTLRLRLNLMQGQFKQLTLPTWRPSRLSLAQAVLLDPKNDWLERFIKQKHPHKVHLFHLDAEGKATELADAGGALGLLTDPADAAALDRARKAVDNLEPLGRDSQLGLSLREVINRHRGPSLTAVVMVTDGVTTREEPLASLESFVKVANVPVFFFGLGVEKEDSTKKKIQLIDLQVEDTMYLGDIARFQAKIVSKGYKEEVPIVLKLKEKEGLEKEVDRVKKRLDDSTPVKFTLKHQPEEVGKKTYIIEVEVPKGGKDKGPSKLRLERTIEVIETDQVKVLYVEGQPRYEFRYLKNLLEREGPDERKRRSIRINALLLDADLDWHEGFREDRLKEKDKEVKEKRILKDFPSAEQLATYNVIIIGDVDPHHAKLGKKRLEMIADRVRGDGKGDGDKSGAGLLFLAGPFHSPHAFKDTPLGPLLPVEPTAIKPLPEPEERVKELRLEWTTLGRLNNLFKLGPDDTESAAIWRRLQPMFWWSSGYRPVENAEVLAGHPGEGARNPLIVELPVGKGRSLFFGFEESWRWRRREDEQHYNRFWIQTMRYLARVQHNRTEVRLDKQVPYKEGDLIKITVSFPDGMAGRKGAKGLEDEVTVIAQHRDADREGNLSEKAEEARITLAKVGENNRVYEATLAKARAGKYKFWLSSPDVREFQPDKQYPFAEAIVELPPLEMEDLKMNREELEKVKGPGGQVYTLADAHQLPENLEKYVNDLFDPDPSDPRRRNRPVSGFTLARHKLWNHWLCFGLAVLLFTGEWVLRKKKHML